MSDFVVVLEISFVVAKLTDFSKIISHLNSHFSHNFQRQISPKFLFRIYFFLDFIQAKTKSLPLAETSLLTSLPFAYLSITGNNKRSVKSLLAFAGK